MRNFIKNSGMTYVLYDILFREEHMIKGLKKANALADNLTCLQRQLIWIKFDKLKEEIQKIVEE